MLKGDSSTINGS
jgi:hypothetical protein